MPLNPRFSSKWKSTTLKTFCCSSRYTGDGDRSRLLPLSVLSHEAPVFLFPLASVSITQCFFFSLSISVVIFNQPPNTVFFREAPARLASARGRRPRCQRLENDRQSPPPVALRGEGSGGAGARLPAARRRGRFSGGRRGALGERRFFIKSKRVEKKTEGHARHTLTTTGLFPCILPSL